VKALSDPTNDVRAKAADALRPLLAADPSIAPNWHDKAFWTKQIEKCKPGIPLDEALAILLPDLSSKERKQAEEGGAWSGVTGCSFYQLDDYWRAGFQLKDFEKPQLLEVPKLEPFVREVWIKPADHFTGLWVTWHVNGTKGSESEYRDGKRDGMFTSFYGDGSKCYEQKDREDQADGPGRGWFKSGKKMYEIEYKNGKQEGTWRHWHENGRLASEHHYKDGQQDGLHTSWFENGQKQYEDEYRKGKREGLGAAWDEHGKLLYKRMYHNDEVVEPR
jgi:hypothetical protein